MPNEWDLPPDAAGNDEEDEEDEEIGPDSPDYDLSEAHGYTWEPARDNWPVPPWLLVAISLLVVVALLLPGLLFLLRNS